MFRLRNCTIFCTKWAHFKFDACYRSQNSWARLPLCSISSSVQNNSKTSGHRGYEFLEFWCWNLVPIWTDIGFQLLKSLWSSLTYFSFNDVLNILYRWKNWTAGRPIQHPDSSTMKPCHCNAAVCGFTLSCWNTRRLEGSICCSKTFIYHSAFFQWLPKHGSCPYRMHVCTSIPSETLAFELNILESFPSL